MRSGDRDGIGDLRELEQRQEARRQRLLRIAERLEAPGNARYQGAREMASAIPFGQPILVGHHSEQRDRAPSVGVRQRMLGGFCIGLPDTAGSVPAQAARGGRGRCAVTFPSEPRDRAYQLGRDSVADREAVFPHTDEEMADEFAHYRDPSMRDL